MIGSLVMSAGSAIAGNVATNRAYKDFLGYSNDERNYYRRRLGRDLTKTTENQSIINEAKDVALRNYNTTRAANIVAGGTDQSLALAQRNGQGIVSDALRTAALNASRERRALESEAMQSQRAINAQKLNFQMQKAKNISAAGGQASKAFAGILSNPEAASTSVFDIFGINKKNNSNG